MNDSLAITLAALEKISERDPQSPTCGPAAPEICENGCIGCIARAALRATTKTGNLLDHYDYGSRQCDCEYGEPTYGFHSKSCAIWGE